MKDQLRAHLVETGEIDNLKQLLKTRLIQCGWRDEMKALCREIVKEKGVDAVTIDDLVKEVTSKGREKVPDAVKKELLHEIKNVLK